MCRKEFQVEGADTKKAPRGRVTSNNTGWSGKEICIGRMQGSGCVVLNFASLIFNYCICN